MCGLLSSFITIFQIVFFENEKIVAPILTTTVRMVTQPLRYWQVRSGLFLIFVNWKMKIWWHMVAFVTYPKGATNTVAP
jgi:hypothetical protein